MCLILFAYRSHPDYDLLLLANRDEYYDRPSSPAGFWAPAGQILAGRDLVGSGTWLGVSRSGRFAAITNVRDVHQRRKGGRSRGLLASDFLAQADSPDSFGARIVENGHDYAGFNLLLGDPGQFCCVSNYRPGVEVLTPGIYGLSNHLLDTPWPKVLTGKNDLQTLLQSGDLTDERCFSLLADTSPAADEQLPDTGIGLEWERRLSPRFIQTADYGTRCSTLVMIRRDGLVRFVERTFDKTPDRWEQSEQSFWSSPDPS